MAPGNVGGIDSRDFDHFRSGQPIVEREQFGVVFGVGGAGAGQHPAMPVPGTGTALVDCFGDFQRLVVMPTKARIHVCLGSKPAWKMVDGKGVWRHPLCRSSPGRWMPAFAGMT